MIGILIISIGAFFDEMSTSLGKWNVIHKREGIYTLGFLNLFWGFIFFIFLAIYENRFVFTKESLGLFAIYMVLEILQTYSSLEASVKADRSTFGFVMIGTVPLLLFVDYCLGYHINTLNVIGISITVLAVLILMINHGLTKKGIWYVIFSTINAVATISLYKYIITNYNSVEAQSIVALTIVLTFLFIMAKYKDKENPLKFVLKREFLLQSLSRGVSTVLISFAYLFAPASFVAGARRGVSVLWSILSGNIVFHEKHFILKMFCFALVVLGLILLVIY